MGTTKRTSDPGSRSVFTYEIELTSTVCLDEFSKTSSISKQVNSRFHCFVYLTMELLKVVLLLLVTLLSRRCLHVKALETSIRLCSYRNTVSSAIIQRKKWRSELSRMPLPSAKQRSTVSLRVLLDGGGSREEQQSLLSMECDTEADSTHHSLSPKALSTAAAVQRSPSHFLSSLQFWKKHTEKGDESLTFKQKLAKAGMSTLLSYGFVSNMSYAVTVSIAWYISAKRSGLSPLTKGQWPGFLAIYSGFYVFNNIVRPARFALSIGVSRYFDTAVNSIQSRLKCSKPVAVGILVVLANVFGTTLAMGLGISLASKAAGVPVRPR